jgi:hypothetical protein
MLSRPYLWPPDHWFRVKARFRRSRPDQVDYCEGVLHLLYNKICLKMIDHGSRSTWAQVLPDPVWSRLGLGGLGLTKLTTGKEHYTFCIIKFA